MWEETRGVCKQKKDVAAEGENVNFFGDVGGCGGSFDVRDEAGMAEGVSVSFSRGRHGCVFFSRAECENRAKVRCRCWRLRNYAKMRGKSQIYLLSSSMPSEMSMTNNKPKHSMAL